MTNEQIAALRAARQRMKSAVKISNWEDALEAFWEICTPVTIDSLLDHIAKLEAGRDTAIEECAAQFERFFASSDEVSIDYVVGSIRALKSAPLTDDQRHEAVSQILKGE